MEIQIQIQTGNFCDKEFSMSIFENHKLILVPFFQSSVIQNILC